MSTLTLESVRPSIPVQQGTVTPDDLIQINGILRDGLYELVDGNLVKKPMSLISNWVGGRITSRLTAYLDSRPMGFVFPETTFRCFPEKPSQIRIPDVAFFAAGRLPAVWPDGHVRLVPDLIVEVVSPSDVVYNLDEKLEEYRAVGVPLVWVVNPDSRVIRVRVLGRPDAELRDGETLRGDPLLPGFAVAVADVMPPRQTVPA